MSSDAFQGIKPEDFSYSNSFASPRRHYVIRLIENLTGRMSILRLVRRHKNSPPLPGSFWDQVMGRMGINTQISPESLAKIPKTGPLIIIANHPHGMVDGMVLCHIMSMVRSDFKIMTRAFLAKVPDVYEVMLPVAFDHEENAIRKNVNARKEALEHVKSGGCLILFPAGKVANSKEWFGDAVDDEWTPFLARLILRGKAAVSPIFFTGQNSRLYLLAAKFSPTLRQGLLMHEVVRSLNTDMLPIVGDLIPHKDLAARDLAPRDLTAQLRETTLALGANA